MGNCQTAEAATVVIEHPGGRVERVYWSVTASHVMASNPGHYVAVIITSPVSSNAPSPAATTSNGKSGSTAPPVKHLKLLRPDDTLHIGHVYRLVGFEEVLKEFATKKHVRLSKLLAAHNTRSKKRGEGVLPAPPDTEVGSSTTSEVEGHAVAAAAEDSGRRSTGGPISRPNQWKPALQSIAEFSS